MALQRGVYAPDFEATDIAGKRIGLSALRGKPVLLAFHRFSTCPFCNFRIHQLKTRFGDLHARGLEAIAVFESSEQNLRDGVAKQNVPFPLISDRELRLYRLYEVETSFMGAVKAMLVRNEQRQESKNLGLVATIPREGSPMRMPADFLITPEGKIHTAYYGKDMGDHLPLEQIAAFLG